MKVCEKCLECGICQKKCPFNAIKMVQDGLFYHAEIDENKCKNCNMCHNICPNNKEYKQNKINVYVGRLNNDDINLSTSGGIFGECARKILDEGGIVYGAAFNEEFKVNHIRVDSINDVTKILKSKYVKSNLNNIFEKVEHDLKENKIVLFSGTPCQISSLKQYLLKDYQNLYNIDIICHGNPSSLVWEKYLAKLKEKGKIKNIDFRYNNIEHPENNFLVEYENGEVINESLYGNSYGKSFLVNMLSDKCCFSCNYKNFKNVSDITLGDAYGYNNELYKNKNSEIFINTKKGNQLFNKIKNKLLLFENFNLINLIQNNYPIVHSPLKHYNSLNININTKNIEKELINKLDPFSSMKYDKKNVGILNFQYENFNYGANLVAYSLKEAVKKLGYIPYNINFDPFPEIDPILRYRTMGFIDFRNQNLNLTPEIKSKDNLKVLNKYFDTFITGSDQVWRKTITVQNYDAYFLNFANKDKRKISYAASFGNKGFEGDCLEKLNVMNLLNEFTSISVREEQGIDILEKELMSSGKLVLDPTMLLTKKDYDKLIFEEYKEPVDVAVYYVMDFDNKILNDKNFKRLFPKKNIVNVKGNFENNPYGKIFKFNSISKWLDGIKKCEYLVTDSFHGVVFGILYNKKIICTGKNSKSLSRFLTLFNELGGNLEKINYGTLDEVKKIDFVPNYTEINNNLELKRKESYKFLEDSLTKKVTNKENDILNTINIITNNLKQELDKKNEEVNILNNQKNELVNIIISMENSRSWKITKPLRKLKRIVQKVKK